MRHCQDTRVQVCILPDQGQYLPPAHIGGRDSVSQGGGNYTGETGASGELKHWVREIGEGDAEAEGGGGDDEVIVVSTGET